MTWLRDQHPRDIIKPAGMKNDVISTRSVVREKQVMFQYIAPSKMPGNRSRDSISKCITKFKFYLIGFAFVKKYKQSHISAFCF